MFRRFSDWPIRARLYLCTLVAILGLLGVSAFESYGRTTDMANARIDQLRVVVDTAIASAARFEAEERAGRMQRAEAQAAALETIRAIRYAGDGYFWINDAEVRPRLIMHPFRKEMEGTDVSQVKDAAGTAIYTAFADVVRKSGSGVVAYVWPRPGAKAGDPSVEKLSFVKGFTPWNWVIGTGVYVDDLRQAQFRSIVDSAAMAGLAVVLVGLLTWLVGRSIARPLAASTAATSAMAAGDLDVPVPGAERRDEFGLLARALETFRENGLKAQRLEAQAQIAFAARERRQAAMDLHTQEFGTSISGVMLSLGGAADQMRQAAGEMARAVEQTCEGTIATAAGAEVSACNLSSVAAATEELSASVGEIARQVAQAAGTAREAVGRAQVTDTMVRSLSDAAGQVGDVVQLIASIAGKTNLLALNATIEAARAGEAGKGFAVVASEVKQLAAQTARATEQISAQVNAIQTATGEAVGAVRDMGEAIGRIDEISSAIAAAVEEQGAATREIADRVQTVAQQNDDATRSMRDVSHIAKGAGAASGAVLTSASEIAQVSGILSKEVDHFLASVRSDESEQRSYERIPGGNAPATVRLAGQAEISAVLADISRGGAALVCTVEAAPGTDAQMMLPGAAAPIRGRVVRAGQGSFAVFFQQDPATLAQIDRVLAQVKGMNSRMAA